MFSFAFSSLRKLFTQKHFLCPKEYRGKKIKVKNRPDFFACEIGGGVWK